MYNTVRACLRTCQIVSQKQERKRIAAFVKQINPLNYAGFSANVISKGTPCVRICASRDCDGIMHARARACHEIVVIIYRAIEIHTRIAPRACVPLLPSEFVTRFFGKTDFACSKSILQLVPRERADRASATAGVSGKTSYTRGGKQTQRNSIHSIHSYLRS